MRPVLVSGGVLVVGCDGPELIARDVERVVRREGADGADHDNFSGTWLEDREAATGVHRLIAGDHAEGNQFFAHGLKVAPVAGACWPFCYFCFGCRAAPYLIEVAATLIPLSRAAQ